MTERRHKPNNSLLSVFLNTFPGIMCILLVKLYFLIWTFFKVDWFLLSCILCCLLSFSYSKITNCCHLCRRVDLINWWESWPLLSSLSIFWIFLKWRLIVHALFLISKVPVECTPHELDLGWPPTHNDLSAGLELVCFNRIIQLFFFFFLWQNLALRKF